MQFILEYRAYFDIAIVIVGVITLLLLLRPVFAWYFKYDEQIHELKRVNEQLKKQNENVVKLQKLVANQQAVQFNKQASSRFYKEPDHLEPQQSAKTEHLTTASRPNIAPYSPSAVKPEKVESQAKQTRQPVIEKRKEQPTNSTTVEKSAKTEPVKTSKAEKDIERREPTINFDSI
ncbi:hypothetical protein [Algibacillus agarilyticus]|uniref:hypothetical protein n=1 Tax=Algibacillus agarilyticus TaxID=2234133 RepID=UPI000DD0ABD8|nr:hypothetical protein [Algibacillus agarilyticus]